MQAIPQALTISEFQSMLQSDEQETLVSLLKPFITAVTLREVQDTTLQAGDSKDSYWAGWG